MANDNYYVKCPFYRKDEPVKIHCEGLSDDSRVILQFNTAKAKRRHMNKFCKKMGDYKNCEICRMLIKKYGE